jgi:light-regulated signal transduction histidine kinase (bacteriophytochrome)
MVTADKIKELCLRVITAEGEQFDQELLQLRSAIRIHCEDLQNMTMATVLKMPLPATKKDGTDG